MRSDVSICGCLIRLCFVCNTNLKARLYVQLQQALSLPPRCLRQVTAESGARIARLATVLRSRQVFFRLYMWCLDTASSTFLNSHQVFFHQPPCSYRHPAFLRSQYLVTTRATIPSSYPLDHHLAGEKHDGIECSSYFLYLSMPGETTRSERLF
jgi:hypothetical protein